MRNIQRHTSGTRQIARIPYLHRGTLYSRIRYKPPRTLRQTVKTSTQTERVPKTMSSYASSSRHHSRGYSSKSGKSSSSRNSGKQRDTDWMKTGKCNITKKAKANELDTVIGQLDHPDFRLREIWVLFKGVNGLIDGQPFTNHCVLSLVFRNGARGYRGAEIEIEPNDPNDGEYVDMEEAIFGLNEYSPASMKLKLHQYVNPIAYSVVAFKIRDRFSEFADGSSIHSGSTTLGHLLRTITNSGLHCFRYATYGDEDHFVGCRDWM